MKFLSLRRWSNSFEIPGVVQKIRRVIQASVDRGECVCVEDDGARGLAMAIRQDLEKGWPPDKVKFSRAHPGLSGATSTTPRRRRLR